MKLKVLFVDDEVEILDSFKAMLLPFKNNWQTYFASSGKDGLKILSQNEINIIISDMVMPEMDGLTFLLKAKSLYPRIIRLVLSGYSDYERAIISTKVAHQFLSKPCSAEELIFKITNLEEIYHLLTDQNVIKFIDQIDNIPVMPEIYRKIENEFKKNNPSLNKIAEIIAEDISLTAKILQIVNSAFFSIPTNVKDLVTAINFLGINLIKSLVLASSFFDLQNLNDEEKIFLNKVWKHSLKVGQISYSISKNSNLNKYIVDQAYFIGLLHDLGKLPMITNKDYSDKMVKFNNDDQDLYYQKEINNFQTSHASIGAYILGLWGLDNVIVKSILNHHEKISIDWENLTQQSLLRIADVTASIIDDDLNEIKSLKINDEFVKKFNELKK